MNTKFNFVREGAGSRDDYYDVKEIEQVIGILNTKSCRGAVSEILIDNVICVWSPDQALQLFGVIKEYLGQNSKLIICDLKLKSYCNAVSDNHLSGEEAPKALYGRRHVYNIEEVCGLIAKSGLSITRKKIDRLSLIVEAGPKIEH